MTAGSTITMWAPQLGPQAALVTSPIEDVFYGGARGGGKTDALLGDVLLRADRYGPAFRGVLFRRTYTPELEEMIARSRQLFPRLGWEYNAGSHTWTHANGATLLLRHLDNDADADNYQGHQYCWMGFDELGNWPRPASVDKLWGALRSPAGVPCVRRCTGNPGGVGHQWVRARYITAAPAWTPFRHAPQPHQPALTIEAVFIPARLEDNPLLQTNDPGYERRLAAAGGEALYKAWRFGDWDAVVGAVFSEWRQDLHVLPGDFQAPPHWRWGAAIDFGYSTGGWFGLFVRGEREIFVMDELPLKGVYAYEAGRRCAMLAQQYGEIEYVASDSAMGADTGIGANVAEEFQRGWDTIFGGPGGGARLVPCVKGHNSRAAGVQLMHHALAWKAATTGQVPPWGQPLLKFHPRCTTAISTIPALPYDPHRPEDVDTDADDHAYDAIRYFLASRGDVVLRPHVWQLTDVDHIHPGIDPATGRRRSKNVDRMLAAAGLQPPSPPSFVPRGPTMEIPD